MLLTSTITRSPGSTYALVKPHATLPLLPATIAGVPGSVTPVTLVPGYSNDARYQVLGTPWSRCMSFATIAVPVAVCAPPRANTFEPITASESRGSNGNRMVSIAASRGPEARQVSMGNGTFTAPILLVRRLTCFALGIGAAGPVEPSRAASFGVTTGAKNAKASRPN